MIEMRPLRFVARLLPLLLLVFFATSVAAAPSARDKREAAKLDREADALVKKGDRDQAVDRLQQADSLDPSPARKVRLAKVLSDLLRLMEATTVLESAIQDKPKDRKQKEAIGKAQKMLDDVRARTPTITVKIVKPQPAQVTVQIDGKPFDPALGPQPFDPGYHTLVATAPQHSELRKEVSLAERATETVTVSLVPTTPPEEVDEGGGGIGPWPAIVSWSLGAVGLGFGIGFGVVAINDTNALLDDYNCDGDRCPAEAQADLDSAKLEGNISTVGFVVAGVGLAAGIIFWLVGDSSDDGATEPVDQEGLPSDEAGELIAHVEPMLGPGFVGLAGTF